MSWYKMPGYLLQRSSLVNHLLIKFHSRSRSQFSTSACSCLKGGVTFCKYFYLFYKFFILDTDAALDSIEYELFNFRIQIFSFLLNKYSS